MRVTAAAFAIMATSMVAAQYDEAEGADGYGAISMRDMVKVSIYKRGETEEPISVWVHKSFKVRSEDGHGAVPQLQARDDKNKTAAAKDKAGKPLPKPKTFKVELPKLQEAIVKWVPKPKSPKPKGPKKDKEGDKKEGDKKGDKKEADKKGDKKEADKKEAEKKEAEKKEAEKKPADKDDKKDGKKPKTAEERKASREKAKANAQRKFETGSCGKSTFTNKTTIDAPFTGGCLAIRNWAKKNPGRWEFPANRVQGEINLIVAGSNSGANCRFAVRGSSGQRTYIANVDVRDLVNDAHRRFRVRYGKSSDPRQGHRMAAEGVMKCDKVVNGTTSDQSVSWAILKYDGQI